MKKNHLQKIILFKKLIFFLIKLYSTKLEKKVGTREKIDVILFHFYFFNTFKMILINKLIHAKKTKIIISQKINQT